MTSLGLDSKKALPTVHLAEGITYILPVNGFHLSNSQSAQKAKAMQWVLYYNTPHFWKHKAMAGSFRDVIWKPNTETALLSHT